MEEISGWVYEGKLDKLTASIAKMNRKAVKLGCTPIVLTVTTEEVYRPINPEDIHGPKARFIKVLLFGESPKLSDWQFVSACDHDPVLGMTVKTVPNKMMPVQYRENSSFCEHCKSDRQRNTTYIVENVKTGEFKRVGSTCIKDFLGHKAAESFLFYASFISMVQELEDEMGYDGCGERGTLYYNLTMVLAITAKCVAKWGYTSATKVKDTGEGYATRDDVFDQLHPAKGDEDKVFKITEADLEAVRPMVEWAKNLPETSDYNLTLIRLAMADATKAQLMGFAVSIVPQYNKAMDLNREMARKKPSEFVGELKQRLTLKLQYLQSFASDGFYGVSYYHKFEDESGNKLSWHTKESIDATQSCWFTVVGTVAAHDTYSPEGKSVTYKTTNLSRCKLTMSMVPLWSTEKVEEK